MSKKWTLIVFLCIVPIIGVVSCKRAHHSSFVQSSIKQWDLQKSNYKMIKQHAIGESTGFKLLWIAFVSPTEAEAKQNMLDRLKNEGGFDLTGKHLAFANATSERGGFSLVGLIAAPSIILTADVIEILDQ